VKGGDGTERPEGGKKGGGEASFRERREKEDVDAVRDTKQKADFKRKKKKRNSTPAQGKRERTSNLLLGAGEALKPEGGGGKKTIFLIGGRGKDRILQVGEGQLGLRERGRPAKGGGGPLTDADLKKKKKEAVAHLGGKKRAGPGRKTALTGKETASRSRSRKEKPGGKKRPATSWVEGKEKIRRGNKPKGKKASLTKGPRLRRGNYV